MLLADAQAFGVGNLEASHHCRHYTFEMALWAQVLWKPDTFAFDEESARKMGKVKGGKENPVD